MPLTALGLLVPTGPLAPTAIATTHHLPAHLTMPHLTIEYTTNLPHYPEAETLTALNAALCAHPEIQDEADLKTRFVVADSFETGTASASRAFVHAQLRLLAGRSPQAKKELSEAIAAVLRERTPRPPGVTIYLSVEVVDMDRGSYAKERL